MKLLIRPFDKFYFKGFNTNSLYFNIKHFSQLFERTSILENRIVSLPFTPNENNDNTNKPEEIKAEFMNKRKKLAKRKRAKRKFGKKISLNYK